MNRLIFSMVLAVAGAAMAQESPLPEPPLVPADTPPPMPPAQPSGDQAEPSGVLKPPAIANQVEPEEDPQPSVPAAPPTAATQADKVATREIRIAMSLLIGAGFGLGGGIAGGVLGATRIQSGVTVLGPVWTGAAIGWCIGVPVGVLFSGWLFDGDGKLWATVIGDALGAVIGAIGIAFSGGIEGLPLLFALPLAGAVIGYEATSQNSRSAVRPVVSVGPRGGFVGVAGVF